MRARGRIVREDPRPAKRGEGARRAGEGRIWDEWRPLYLDVAGLRIEKRSGTSRTRP